MMTFPRAQLKADKRNLSPSARQESGGEQREPRRGRGRRWCGRDGETNDDDVQGTWCKVANWDTTEWRATATGGGMGPEWGKGRRTRRGFGEEQNEVGAKVERSRSAVLCGRKGSEASGKGCDERGTRLRARSLNLRQMKRSVGPIFCTVAATSLSVVSSQPLLRRRYGKAKRIGKGRKTNGRR